MSNLKYGFYINSWINRSSVRPIPNNHRSALQNQEVVTSKITKDIEKGHILGPFQSPPPNTIFSPIGLVPKKELNQFRLIHDLSYPSGSSINDFIPPASSYVSYETFDDFVSILLSLPEGALMAKADIKAAFRNLPINPSDYDLLGFHWKGKYYLDKRMPMGASSSCSAFESLSTAIQWILNQFGVKDVTHILDDFMFLGPPDDNTTLSSLKFFLLLMEYLYIPINHDKTFYPSTQIIVHGIFVDSTLGKASLPLDKLNNLLQRLQVLIHKRSVILRELQSILGLLNFACRVIRPGRAFSQRLINLTIGTSNPNHHIRLTSEAKNDISIWLQFLAHFNGTSLLLDLQWKTSQHLHLFSDASLKGFGVVFSGEWAWGPWLGSLSVNHHITVLELYPIVLSVLLWGDSLSNSCVEFHSDNSAVVDILNKQSSKHPVIMTLVRIFVLKCLQLNIYFRLRHIPGMYNIVPDLLSRLQVSEAQDLAPYLHPEPATIPPHWQLSRLLQDNCYNQL